jgi:hypothetical protein
MVSGNTSSGYGFSGHQSGFLLFVMPFFYCPQTCLYLVSCHVDTFGNNNSGHTTWSTLVHTRIVWWHPAQWAVSHLGISQQLTLELPPNKSGSHSRYSRTHAKRASRTRTGSAPPGYASHVVIYPLPCRNRSRDAVPVCMHSRLRAKSSHGLDDWLHFSSIACNSLISFDS